MDKLNDIIKTEVEAMGFYLYQTNFHRRGKDYVLAVEIDHKEPISIDDCVRVSERLSAVLDEKDPIEQAYMLEVSSAGAEHTLRNREEMLRAVDKFIHIRTGDQTIYEGVLVSVDESSLEILDKKQNKTVAIPFNDIEKIRLAVDF